MTDVAIQVENLGKAYRIGLKEEIPDTLVGAMTSWLKAPARNFRRLRQLNTFNRRLSASRPFRHRRIPPQADSATGGSSDNSRDIIWALRDVNFDVRQGEVVGVIGRNGAGKSTLLKILSRITDPTTGRAVIHGRVSSLLEVGTGFHPELTGRENVYMNGTILGMSKREIDRKFDEIVEFSGVETFLDTPVKRYSSGMKVRLAFAVAAHLQPEILIVDEVLAVGDAAFQRKCLGKMDGVARSGHTVLFVSHNMAAVQNLCRRCILLECGALVQDSDVDRAIDQYAASVRQLLETPVAERTDRTGNGKVRLTSIRCRNIDGEFTSAVLMGENWTIELIYECSVHISRPHVGLAISTAAGQRVTRLLSSETYGDLPAFKDRVILHCEVSDLNLVPGHYLVTSALSADRIDLVDRIDGALTVEIIPSNHWANGRVSDMKPSLCYFPCKWRILSNAGSNAS